MQKVRLGIVGPGRIVHRVMKDLRKAEHIDITAVASRSIDRARAAAEELGIPMAFGSYEEMAASDAIDMAYVALPHPLHCAVTKMFLEQGKHVICEKPFAVNETEADEMIGCAREHGVFLMEAMWTRFFPMSVALKKALEEGVIGDVRFMTGDFAMNPPYNPADRLFDRALGGGSLLDVGVYPLSIMCYFKGSVPEAAQVLSMKTPTDVDALCGFQLQWPDGAVGQGFSAVNVQTEHILRLYGTKGMIEVPHFWHPDTYYIKRHDGKTEEVAFEKDNEGFWYEFEYAAGCILAGEKDQPVISLEETRKIMKLMTDMRKTMGVTYPNE